MKTSCKIWIRKFLLFVLVAIFLPSFISSAHPGRTDSNGGHHDYDNVSGLGNYHYHHGYPAHLHENGVCPYDFDDNTDRDVNNTSIINDKNNSTASSSSNIASKSPKKDSDHDVLKVLSIGVGSFAGLYITYCIIDLIVQKRKRKKKAQPYYDAYANKEPLSCVDAPPGVFIVDNLPATNHHHKYGLYSVYVTPTGNCYHRRKSCAGKTAQLTNLYLVYKKRYPCSICCKEYKPNTDFTWYEKYLEIIETKKKYKIP